MKPLSRLAESLPRSGIRAIMEIASKMDQVINLSVGEPSFNTPNHIINAAFDDAESGWTKYTSNYGMPVLRQTIAETYTKRWGRPVGAENVLVSAGGVNAIGATVFAIVEAGDEILVPDPGWPNYMSIAGVANAHPVRYALRAENGFLPDPAEIERLVTERTKILIVCNPSNPTGAVFPAERVESLVDLARRRDLYLISDEIYEHLVFDGEHIPASSFDQDGRVITVSGFSKTYAMTGWRLGYAIGNPDLIRLAGKLEEPLVSCASAVSQRAGLAALTGPQGCVGEMRAAYQRRRDIARDVLEPAGLLAAVPRGAFYAMIDLRACGMSGGELAKRLLEEERVATAPGDTFGPSADGMVRISLASSDEHVAEGCKRIVAFAERYSAAAAMTAVAV